MYFIEPKKSKYYGGVSNVAYFLPKALSKKTALTYFPAFYPRIGYATSILNVYRRLVAGDFEVVHFNIIPHWTKGGYSLPELAKITNTSTILNIHGIIQLEYALYGTGKNRFWQSSDQNLSRIMRYCRMVDKLVTYSEFMRKRIETFYQVNKNKIVVIPNGVNVDKFSECTNEVTLNGDPAILYLGHLSKGADFLIDAISKIQPQLPKLRLHLVGGGDIPSLKQIARKRGIESSIVFHGSIKPENTPGFYKAADIFVFPTIWTPAGITILESMASGTPIIASNRGGVPEIISHGKDGLLFDPNDPNALPSAILELYSDQKLAKKIKENALTTVKEYSWENIAKKYSLLYENLKKERNR